ncbi:FadR/GntR family transcriptional regulator [Mesorhizobium sp. BE184]|uniref:FadR/GntR family transcriptional regulator n=1 Tax=Mesorhizobium sp. BE184 TaxID=2817714 RepID=UPI00285BCBA0|nr:FadR/GntR family transcriptional regulator [Mesorhizobium sp. BE184]MDR7032319.1 DNA-binding FadR family transcriptional regulator [Mesorhizobium sp. BE184]
MNSVQSGLSRTLAPKGIHGHVMGDLGRGIVSGALPENSILPRDAELQQRYGVSRTVLREALKTLAAKGLIQPKAKIGTRVVPRDGWNLFDPDILQWHADTGVVDAQFLFNLQEMRLALEPEAAALAALRRTDAQVGELYHWVDLMGAAGITGNDFVQHDLHLHICVAEASGNPFMRAISALIEVALVATFTVSSPIPNTERHKLSVQRHRDIARAIEDRDPQAARTAMRRVIQEGIDRVSVETGRKPEDRS